jgi:putative DNA primase/helicase
MSRARHVADWAFAYTARLGLWLTYTPPGQKGPRHRGWQCPENAITVPELARLHWQRNPNDGVAVLLGLSGLVSLDIDDYAAAHVVLAREGIDLSQGFDGAPCIVGRGSRFMFRAPAGETLRTRWIRWPARDGGKRSVVLELRAGDFADTLPPTIHATLGRPYRWRVAPTDGFPELPARLLELWHDPEFDRRARAACPWAPPEPPPPPPRAPRVRDPNAPSVIDEFNAAHDVGAILEAHGYVRKGKRYQAPGSDTHAAGIRLSDDGCAFCWHASDPLAGDGGKPRPLDAFDCYRILEHGGDYRAAIREAARALGLDRRRTA